MLELFDRRPSFPLDSQNYHIILHRLHRYVVENIAFVVVSDEGEGENDGGVRSTISERFDSLDEPFDDGTTERMTIKFVIGTRQRSTTAEAASNRASLERNVDKIGSSVVLRLRRCIEATTDFVGEDALKGKLIGVENAKRPFLSESSDFPWDQAAATYWLVLNRSRK